MTMGKRRFRFASHSKSSLDRVTNYWVLDVSALWAVTSNEVVVGRNVPEGSTGAELRCQQGEVRPGVGMGASS